MPSVLILTPVKDAGRWLAGYWAGLQRLQWPARQLSLGLLESDSRDDTWQLVCEAQAELSQRFSAITVLQHHWGFRITTGRSRHAFALQLERRRWLAKSRNRLLRATLRASHDWVLWLDVDVVGYPADLIQQLLAYNQPILNPIVMRKDLNQVYDLNAWRDQGRTRMEDLRQGAELEPLDAVGGACLLIRADCHRAGLRFPEEPWSGPLARDPNPWGGAPGELETEGLGLMAHSMGWQPYGLPHLAVTHG